MSNSDAKLAPLLPPRLRGVRTSFAGVAAKGDFAVVGLGGGGEALRAPGLWLGEAGRPRRNAPGEAARGGIVRHDSLASMLFVENKNGLLSTCHLNLSNQANVNG